MIYQFLAFMITKDFVGMTILDKSFTFSFYTLGMRIIILKLILTKKYYQIYIKLRKWFYE